MSNSCRVIVMVALGSVAVACSSDGTANPGSSPEAGAGETSSSGGGGGSGGATPGSGGTTPGSGGTTPGSGGAQPESGGTAGSGNGGATTVLDASADGSRGDGSAGNPDAGTDARAGGAGGKAVTDGGADAGPATTGVGNLVAGVPPASASIDAAGGTLTSGDGQLTLTVPAGALSAATTIGIVAIDNLVPGGTGYAYRLTPDGQTFAKPVTLAFKPTYGQFDGSSAAHVRLAFQDAEQKWETVPVTADATTVTATTTHFTDYAYLLDLAITGDTVLFTGTGTLLRVVGVTTDGGFVSATAPVALTGNPKWLLDGTALGNGSDGSLDPLANSAAYTAPAQIPSTDPVSVSVSYTASNGAQVTLATEIYILAHKYRLDITLVNNPVCAGGSGYAFNYSSTGSIDLTLDANFNVTSSNPTPSATPTIGAVTVCTTNLCTATPQLDKTTGLTLSSVTGGWQPFLRRLALKPAGTASGSADLQVDCGSAGSYEVKAAANPWNPGGLLGYLAGKDGETASHLVTTAAFTAGQTFKLTVLQP